MSQVSDNGEIKVFAGRGSERFAKRMCACMGAKLGKSTVKIFSDDNIFVRIDESVRGKDVFLVQSIAMNPNDEMMELLYWLDAFRRSSARTVTAIIPFFGYAKGDKQDEPRTSIRARVCADCIQAEGADRVITLDLHSPQIQGFFNLPVDHLTANELLAKYAVHMGIVDPADTVVVSPDAGFAKNAHKIARSIDCSVAIGDKTRSDHNENAKVLDIIGDVDGKNCLIFDDFTISGGTLDDLAHALRDKGAKNIYAFLSHVRLTPKGIERINNSPIEKLVTTDTVFCEEAEQKCPKLSIITAAPLFSEIVQRIHDGRSISEVFNQINDKILDYSFNPTKLDIMYAEANKTEN